MATHNTHQKGKNMAFEINYKKRVAKTLDIELDQVDELLARMRGHLKNKVTYTELARSFFILDDIYKRNEAVRIKQEVPELGFKSKKLLKYSSHIVKLIKKGFSPNQIHKLLNKYKDCPSLSTIKRYNSSYLIWKRDLNVKS